MNLEEVKEALYDVTERFFAGATVIWAEQSNMTPKPPYVTLKLGNLQRSAFPVVTKEWNRFYPCSVRAEINLYTKGRASASGEKATGSYSDSAVTDLMDFFNFIESEYITDMMTGRGIEITLVQPVRDLSELENDSRYRYRAMAEADIVFNMEADGPYGIGGRAGAPNYSGGGTQEMVDAEFDLIEDVEITCDSEGGNDSDD